MQQTSQKYIFLQNIKNSEYFTFFKFFKYVKKIYIKRRRNMSVSPMEVKESLSLMATCIVMPKTCFRKYLHIYKTMYKLFFNV